MFTRKTRAAKGPRQQTSISEDETKPVVEPWNMSRAEWYRLAQSGKLHPNNGKPAPHKIGSQNTALSLGESEGYPPEDIAHFYLARRSRRIGRDRELLTEPEMVDYSRREYVQDAVAEGKSVCAEILSECGLRPSRSRKRLPPSEI